MSRTISSINQIRLRSGTTHRCSAVELSDPCSAVELSNPCSAVALARSENQVSMIIAMLNSTTYELLVENITKITYTPLSDLRQQIESEFP